MNAEGIPHRWDITGLQEAGYAGFLPLLDLDTSPASSPVPREPGTYVLLRPSVEPAVILDTRRGKPHPRHARAYDPAELRVRWDVLGSSAPVVYIGKADQPLRKRLSQFKRAGTGCASHEGGRSVWWLADAHELVVA